MSNNRRLAINMFATLVTFIVGFAISFFLSPFIVGRLGRAAYGFVGLSNNIISYTGLLTVALNSMAGRFVSIHYLNGDKKGANEYFSSVVFANIILAVLIAVIAVFTVGFIQYIFTVPNNLLSDVRLLMSLLFLNSIIGLITGIFSIATFITNRLYLSSIRNVIGNIINAICLVSIFCLFDPHIWYIGLCGLIGSLYTVITNYILKRRLTPDLNANIRNFQWPKIFELLKSGAWNVIGKLNDIFKNGLDLLYANIFVGAELMGTLSISKAVSSIALGLFGAVAGNFSPELTAIYAKGDISLLTHELKKTIRILSCLSTPILCGLYTLSGDFFKLWQPTQDHNQLWILSCLGIVSYILTLPTEGLWNVFTLTNKLKYSTLTLLIESSSVVITVLIAMQLVKDPNVRLMLIAVISPSFGFIRNATFLPMYSAHCIGQKITIFYPPLMKAIISFILATAICFGIRSLFTIDSWAMFLLVAVIIGGVSFAINFIFVLDSNDKNFFKNCVVRATNKITSKL